MADRNLKPNEIEAAGSHYYIPGIHADCDTPQPPLAQSIASIGILTPLITHQCKGTLHLVDGFKRLACARQLGMDSVPYQILPEQTNLHTIFEILVHEQREILKSSVASRARFLRCAQDLGLSEDALVDDFLPILDFQAHPRVLKKLLRIAALPEEGLRFCEEKRFSLKQCAHLTSHPHSLVEKLLAWRDRLTLSASTAEELLDNFGETLNVEQIPLDDLFSEPAFFHLMEEELSPQERTQRLRRWIRARRFPMLTEIESRMHQVQSEMKLPAQISVHWDPALERRELRFVLSLNDPREWKKTLDALREEPVARGIDRLFEDL